MSAVIPVLVTAYNRPDLLEELLNSLDPTQVSHLYLAIDGPSGAGRSEVLGCFRLASEFQRSGHIPASISQLSANAGLAANVIRSVDWVFKHEQQACIIEDDCRPNASFFEFVQDQWNAYEHDSSVWLISGSHPAPPELIDGTHFLSPIPMVWGWATTRNMWLRARAGIVEACQHQQSYGAMLRQTLNPTAIYWESAIRRPAKGFVDSWALPLAGSMRRNGARAVVPKHALVSNVGDDARAVHTAGDASLLFAETYELSGPWLESSKESTDQVVEWLENNIYRPSVGRVMKAWIRRVTEDLQISVPMRPPLLDRLASLPEETLSLPTIGEADRDYWD